MAVKYKNLLSPLVVRGHILKNRMEASNSLPHFLQGNEPFPADSVISHYANKAKNGAAIVTCMGINNFTRGILTDMDFDIAHFPDYDLYDPSSQNYLIQLAYAIHFYDSIACMGFFVGPQAAFPLLENGEIKKIPAHLEVDEYDEKTLEEIAKSYAEQIGILKKLDFDMASVHYAYRGQIPSRFLSPLHNNRTDKYGGSLENRARFPLMILREIRKAVGNNFIIELLFSAEEPEGGYTIDEGVEFIKMASEYIDIVQLRAKDVHAAHPTGFALKETPFIDYAQYYKKRIDNVLIATIGGYHDLDKAEEVLVSGKADIIAMGRAFISNSEYGKFVIEGRNDDVVPCIRCNKCHGRGKEDPFLSVCSVNPIIGIEHKIDKLVTLPTDSKIVAIIGGGPAGMKAAIDLSDRGHKVTLFESTDKLGGNIKHSDYVDFKWPLKEFKNYLIRQVEKRNIDVKLNTRATPEMTSEYNFDVVIAATGAVPFKPPIKGIDNKNVIFATEAMEDKSNVKGDVVVIGGGEVGVETGIIAANNGHNVTVIEMRSRLAADSTEIHYRETFEATWENLPNFNYALNAVCKEVTGDSVIYTDSEGNDVAIKADTVIVSTGMKAKRDEALSFYGLADNFYMIGDCKRPATVQQAIRSAFSTASRI